MADTQIVALEGEQASVFQGIDAQEQALQAQRTAMVKVILAGKGLLAGLDPRTVIQVQPDGIHLIPPPTE